MNDNNADMRDDFTDVEGRRFPVTKPEDTGGLELDRRHAVLLRDDAAANMKDALGRTTREGMRLVRTAKAGDVFELVPSKELAEGLRSGTLRAAAPASGDASVLVKNVRTVESLAGLTCAKSNRVPRSCSGRPRGRPSPSLRNSTISLRSPASSRTSRRASTRCSTCLRITASGRCVISRN